MIATTSELMTTGVDAKTCKLIVLDKTIKSMTTFKQIIGRGTRIEEEYGKYYFTIMDFKKATELFKDADFDGEPVVIYEPGDDDDPVPPDPKNDDDDPGYKAEEPEGVYKARVSGVPVKIIAERVQYLSEEGQLITESYRNYSRKKIRSEFSSLDDFLRAWNDAKKKQPSLTNSKSTVSTSRIWQKEIAKGCGAFDLICHIAYDQPPLTRAERANKVKKRNYFTKYGDKARAVLEALLDKYADEGYRRNRERQGTASYKPFNEIGTPVEIINEVFGGKDGYRACHRRAGARDLRSETIKRELMHEQCKRNHQVHSGHHAQGCGRRWRCPAHQPTGVDVLPQDLR